MEWQELWIQDKQYGARQGRVAEDVFWAMAARLEKAALYGEPLYGFRPDYEKYFDSLPQQILLSIQKIFVVGRHRDEAAVGPLPVAHFQRTARFFWDGHFSLFPMVRKSICVNMKSSIESIWSGMHCAGLCGNKRPRVGVTWPASKEASIAKPR